MKPQLQCPVEELLGWSSVAGVTGQVKPRGVLVLLQESAHTSHIHVKRHLLVEGMYDRMMSFNLVGCTTARPRRHPTDGEASP